jgi:hypothetical protein
MFIFFTENRASGVRNCTNCFLRSFCALHLTKIELKRTRRDNKEENRHTSKTQVDLST